MNVWVKFFTAAILSMLGACSAQQVKPKDAAPAVTPEQSPQPQEQSTDYENGLNPPLTITKDNKTLRLVRIMDGGFCKNRLQGARGSFLVYADPDDIERIKREKSKEVFKDFETKIQNFSSEVLEQAIEQTDLTEDPFSLGEDIMQQKLAAQLTAHFRSAASSALAAFKRETTLTIDVTPFSPSLVFYQTGCDAGAKP